ncbi:Outer membrane lipoprotein-sorting protein [Alteribacillus iranensis]|uniref:Outer membrane lipoprotein-sorting protein n=1 Tax=Alteribacillus iranensis TaxID=930128 RepID=A0A1I2DT52_9BACI|nr:sigma-E factor regulatory protein RseB domain-containing protein [Alteribacillus iranensis]SFE83874.1 Outer membrane lipoprotein-sorting protein [Alteribacillus iranensis]
MKLTKLAGLISLTGVIIMAGCSSGENQYSPAEVINNALEETTELGAYYAEAEMMTNEKGKDPEQILMKEWVSEEGKRRIETETQDGSGKSITVNDGTNLISYQPETKQAFVVEENPDLLSLNQVSPKQQAEQLLEMVQDTHDISLGGEKKVAGRETYHLIAKPKEDNALVGDQELWVDKENWMVLKINSSSGDIKTKMTYTKVEVDPEIPAGTFTFTLPDDAEVQNLEELNQTQEVTLDEASVNIGTPFFYFPETDGLSISRVELLETQGEMQRKEVNVDYQKDGMPYFTMTVFESPEETGENSEMLTGEEAVTVRDQEGTYMEMNDFRSLVWQENGLSYSIIFVDPNMTMEDFKELADKMALVE